MNSVPTPRNNPDDVDAWIDLGLVCRSIGDNRRLRLAGNRIALINRNRFEGYFLLGCSFLEEEDYAKAIEFFSESTKIAPQRSETWLALGMSYEKSGKLVQAFRAYAKADNNDGRTLMTHGCRRIGMNPKNSRALRRRL